MAYQLSEKNQIFVALFAIVVLCAGKLFKDYLFRRGYVEGMLVTTETSTQLRRNAQTASRSSFDAELYFFVTLERDLVYSSSAPQTIQLSWTGTATDDVTTSTTASDYSATVVSGTTSASLSVTGSASPITITPSSETIKAGSKIKITVKVTIYQAASSVGPLNVRTLTFTVTKSNSGSSNSESPKDVKIKILPAFVSGQDLLIAGSSATTAEIKTAIDNINTRLTTGGAAVTDAEKTNLLKARSALVTLLASTYGTIKEAGQVFDSDALYEAQRTAIQFIKSEKERAASNAKALKEDNSNKRRMAQINTYYTKNYEANTEVMKNIIFISIALIILAVLRNKELIPASIGTLGVIFVLTLGGIVVGKQVFDIIRRNDHDFDKYDWNFNEDEMNKKQLLQQNDDPSNLLDMGMGMAPCYGPGCCDVGTSWDTTTKKCIPVAGGRVSGTADWDSNASTLTISLKVVNDLVSSSPADKITITLPPGLFTGRPDLPSSGSDSGKFTGSLSTSGPFDLTVSSTGISNASKEVPNIVITGMSLSPDANALSKKLKVKTTKDINEVEIDITGIQEMN